LGGVQSSGIAYVETVEILASMAGREDLTVEQMEWVRLDVAFRVFSATLP
jgi:hypothetical protein